MEELFTLGNGLYTLLGLAVGWLGKKYLLPLLKVEKRRRYAEWIGQIADEITDDLMARYPDRAWIKFIDEAIDKLMEVCGINKDIAERAVNSALLRKESVSAE